MNTKDKTTYILIWPFPPAKSAIPPEQFFLKICFSAVHLRLNVFPPPSGLDVAKVVNFWFCRQMHL
jgi:hypothetical protein